MIAGFKRIQGDQTASIGPYSNRIDKGTGDCSYVIDKPGNAVIRNQKGKDGSYARLPAIALL
jgi:hypothetical protein